MTETPQSTPATSQMPEQTRGQERITPTEAPRQHRGEGPPPEPTAWAGWVLFGAMMLVMVGAFQAIVGLTALFKDNYYVVGKSGLLVNVNYTAWGWVHLALGVIAVAAGVGLFTGQMWARILGIGMALVSSLVNLAFIAAYPLWSLTVITLDVVVIYAIAMHGKELQSRT